MPARRHYLADAPPEVRTFLEGRGWIRNAPTSDMGEEAEEEFRFLTGGDTVEESWMRPSTTSGEEFTWEQAMAMEFYAFLHLGRE